MATANTAGDEEEEVMRAFEQNLRAKGMEGYGTNLFNVIFLNSWATRAQIQSSRREILKLLSPDYNIALYKEIPDACIILKIAWQHYTRLYEILLEDDKRKAYIDIMPHLPTHGDFVNTNFEYINDTIDIYARLGRDVALKHIKQTQQHYK